MDGNCAGKLDRGLHLKCALVLFCSFAFYSPDSIHISPFWASFLWASNSLPNLAVGQPFQQKTFTSVRFWAPSKNQNPFLQSFMESNGTEIAVVWIYDYINADVQPATAPSLGQLPLWGRVLWYGNTALRFRRTACNLLTSTSQWKYSATYKRQLIAWLRRFSNSSFTSFAKNGWNFI